MSEIEESGLVNLDGLREAMEDLVPFNRLLGFKAEELSRGFVRARCPFKPELIGDARRPALHGGVLGALIEITARVAAQSQDAGGRRPRILNCDIDYLRSARAQSTFASAEIVRQGRRTSLVQVTCRQDGTSAPIARGRVQLLFGAPVDKHEIDDDA